MLETFAECIQAGYLHVGRVEPAFPFFHASVCKNAAHKFALQCLVDDVGPSNVQPLQVVVLNLDVDNVASLHFMEVLLKKAKMMGPFDMIRGSGDDGGVTGRMACFAELWIILGGYDEGMAPSGFQDVDLVLRAKLLGGTSHGFKHDGSAGWSIRNNLADMKRRPRDKIINVSPSFAGTTWDVMNKANLARSSDQCIHIMYVCRIDLMV